MELEQSPEALSYICKSIESFVAGGKKIDDLQEMVGKMHRVVEHGNLFMKKLAQLKKL